MINREEVRFRAHHATGKNKVNPLFSAPRTICILSIYKTYPAYQRNAGKINYLFVLINLRQKKSETLS